MGELTRKVALVTGGSMGLGKAVAEHFAAQGMAVVTCARGGDVTYGCDVSNLPDVQAMIRGVMESFGRIDILVCNAAIYGPVAPLESTDWFTWRRVIEINLLGTVLCCYNVVPIMKQQGSGKIITISGGGARPETDRTSYNTSKAGVQRFTETLAVELSGTGIDVNAVAPGTLPTRMQRPGVVLAQPEAAMAGAVDCITWLASPESNGITGRLFSAVWDDYRAIAEDPSLLGPDNYRMRRIAP